MVSVLFGLLSVALGVWALWLWRVDVLNLLKGLLPLCLTLSGAIAIVMGIVGMKKNEKD
jgi:hypothetical protein